MKRRRFVVAIASTVALWPISVRGQQMPLPVIGFLGPGSPASDASRVEGFRQGLNDSGYVDGKNLTIDYRWAEGHYDRLSAMASDLVKRKVLLIAAMSGSAAVAAKAVETTIPIVF